MRIASSRQEETWKGQAAAPELSQQRRGVECRGGGDGGTDWHRRRAKYLFGESNLGRVHEEEEAIRSLDQGGEEARICRDFRSGTTVENPLLWGKKGNWKKNRLCRRKNADEPGHKGLGDKQKVGGITKALWGNVDFRGEKNESFFDGVLEGKLSLKKGFQDK